jgi:hypothetical protein
MAKLKGLGRGGKRKGAGRPRLTKAGKTSYFSTRITAETRARLEAESRLSGESLSQTIERLLQIGLHEKQARNRHQPIRAMCYLITLLSEMVTVSLLRERNLTHPEYNWRSNPFMFEAFRVAALHLFEALRPPGASVAPLPLKEGLSRMARYDDPEHCGRLATERLLRALQFFGANTPQEVDSAFEAFETDRRVLDTQTQMHYGMFDAARDLGVQCHDVFDETLGGLSFGRLGYHRHRRQPRSSAERENIHGDAKEKGTSGPPLPQHDRAAPVLADDLE